MGNLLFKDFLHYNDNVLLNGQVSTQPTPDWLGNIKDIPLIASLLKYNIDIYACAKCPVLPGDFIDLPCGPTVFTEYAMIGMTFQEPLDKCNSSSVINIWGGGMNDSLAKAKLRKCLNNLPEYEDLLLCSWFAKGIQPEFKYLYHIYDPKEMALYKTMSQFKQNSLYNNRAEPFWCGAIHTNVKFIDKTR